MTCPNTPPCFIGMCLVAALAIKTPALASSPAHEGSYTNSLGMTLNPIPAGEFRMGQAEREKSYRNPWSAEKDTHPYPRSPPGLSGPDLWRRRLRHSSGSSNW